MTRAAVIQIDQAPADIESTKRFLTDLGVRHVQSSHVRAFGRGEELLSQSGSAMRIERMVLAMRYKHWNQDFAIAATCVSTIPLILSWVRQYLRFWLFLPRRG